MMRRIFLLLALALLVGALVAAERQHASAPASAQSLLYLIADSERDLTRLPSNFTRISDAQESAYGTKMADAFLHDRPQLTPDDKEVAAYVAELGSRLAPRA